MVNVTVQHLAIVPLIPENISGLLDAIASINSGTTTPLFEDVTTGYIHSFRIFNSTTTHAQSAFATARARLAQYNLTSIFVSETYATYPDYWTYYAAESGVEPPVGVPAYGAGSRLFDRVSVTSNLTALRSMIGTIVGTPDQLTTNNLELVSGGQCILDAQQRDVMYVKVPAMKSLAPAHGQCRSAVSLMVPGTLNPVPEILHQ
ncbi:hypothetical protein CLAIMM_14937 [Cladophialophora immunda]|nr:hypothetical protein CLAIMM_14937 [Cladophialophora immunda]